MFHMFPAGNQPRQVLQIVCLQPWKAAVAPRMSPQTELIGNFICRDILAEEKNYKSYRE